MAGPGNILIKIGADAGQAVRELGKTDKALGSTMTTSEKMGAGVKKAALPAAAALTAIGYAAIGATKAAAEDAAAQSHLAGVMKRTAGASDAQVKSMEDWISSTSRATGVADDELRPAMENLLGATHDAGKSQKLLTKALDISAASGKDVETVTKAMALATTGQTAKLEKLVPGLSKSAKASDDMNVIMQELSKTTGGAMARSTKTAAGQFKIFQNQTNELQESLGAALLPVVTALTPVMVKLADVAAKNTTAIKILIGVVAGLAAGILAVNAAMKVWTAATKAWTAITKLAAAAQWLWNAALSANPIGLVIIAVGALGVALVILYRKSETFRGIVTGAMNAVKSAVEAVGRAFSSVREAATWAFNWITDHWKLALFAFGPIGIAVYAVATNFNRIREAATWAFNTITSSIGGVVAAIRNLISWLGRITPGGALQAVWEALRKIITAIEKLIGWIGKIHWPKKPGWIPFSLPPVPGAAPVAGARAGALTATAATPGGITVNVFGAVDPEGTARAIRKILERHDRRQGRIV